MANRHRKKDNNSGVSVVIPSLNEESNIDRCLESLLGQSGFTDFEVIVVDGVSKDRTRQIVSQFSRKNGNIRLVTEAKKGAAAGRNKGINAAAYGSIAFIDADCEAPDNWLRVLTEKFNNARVNGNDIIAVGGRNIVPEDAGNFTKAIGIAMDSFPGSFDSVQGRQYRSPGCVLSLSTVNALYDRKSIEAIGLFDESLKSEAEDADLNYRLSRKGLRMLFVPESFVWHRMRPTPKAWFKNMFRYGKGRARLLKKYPDMWRPMYLLPIVFFAMMLSSIMALIWPVFGLSFLYFPAALILSAFQSLKNGRLILSFHVMFVYMIEHFGYAIGFMRGLLDPKVR